MINKVLSPSIEEIRYLRKKTVLWFKKNGRIYPWRETDDPFRILIAEIMLRRTKADQVKVVYEKLFKEYPDIYSFVKANEKKVKKILYPLGLKWRLPAILIVSRELNEKFNCKVPYTREKLKTLTGVGEYVSGAVLSIAYNKREWIVDSNIVRLYKRYFGIKTSIEGRRDKHVIKIAEIYISEGDPRKNNLAILDFTALICTPRDPKCNSCPLNNTCSYYSISKK